MSARAVDPITLYRREKARSERRRGKAYARLMSLAASEFRRQLALGKKGGRSKVAPVEKPCVRCLGPVERLRSRRLTVCDRCASPKELHERTLIRARLAA
jgi:hypothetical protein